MIKQSTNQYTRKLIDTPLLKTQSNKLHDCPNCSCLSPKNHSNGYHYHKESHINSPMVHKSKQYALYNVNLLPPKIFVQHNSKEITCNHSTHQPNSIYLNRGEHKNRTSVSAEKQSHQRRVTSPEIYQLQYPFSTSTKNINMVNLPIISRPITPLLRPISPIASLQNINKPKVNINYLNHHSYCNPPISVSSKTSQDNSEVKSPTILGKSKEKKKKDKQEIGGKGNDNLKIGNPTLGYMGNYASKKSEGSIKFKSMLINNNHMKTTKLNVNRYAEQMMIQQGALLEDGSVSKISHRGSKDQSVSDRQVIGYGKKEIKLNCDHFSEQQVSDRSISDDVEL